MLPDKIVLTDGRETVTFLKAVMTHLRRDEGMQAFREQLKELTPTDRAELSAAFEREFNYRIVERISGLEPTI